MASPSRQTPFHVSPVAGQKRSAPSLLPAFEPLSASPKLPRPIARLPNASPSKNRLNGLAQNYLPSATTSETYIPTSSPPRPSHTRRPGLQRTISALSERAPLATVPSIELDEHGEPTLMGRSSNSSHYQLSTNKLISRIHVRAFYIAPTATEPKKVQIECTGWNGVKVHCQGKAWDLFKGDTFTSETEDSEIMVDVQDARVLLQWPRSKEEELKVLTPTDSEGAGTPWDSENSPSRRAAAGESVRSRGGGGGGGRGGRGGGGAQTSPLRHQYSPRSPVSPSPAVQAASVGLPSRHMASNTAVSVPVQIYEDEPADEVLDGSATQPTQTTFVSSQPLHGGMKDSFATEPDSFSDNDEENDPIVHSFGPFGANLTGRMESFMSNVSPEVRRRALQPLKEESVSPQRQSQILTSPSPKRRRLASSLEATSPAIKANLQSKAIGDGKDNSIVNFAINHLLYSQLSATPLSTLLQHVRAHLKAYPHHGVAAAAADNGEEEYSSASLQTLLQGIQCIGTVQREGKDAAGKQLESEFYYMPERDNDPSRREVVQDMGIGGRGLRNCRKSHKQYYWRKPK